MSRTVVTKSERQVKQTLIDRSSLILLAKQSHNLQAGGELSKIMSFILHTSSFIQPCSAFQSFQTTAGPQHLPSKHFRQMTAPAPASIHLSHMQSILQASGTV